MPDPQQSAPRGAACRICDGSGTTHRLGCPNGDIHRRQVTVQRADLVEALRLLREIAKPCGRDNCDALSCLAVRRLESATSAGEGAK